MKEFGSAKNGYNKQEVQDYVNLLNSNMEQKDLEIAKLKNELEEFKKIQTSIKQKEENISIALTAAVEKAKQIEKSSHNVYKLKIQELEVLYARWERVLNELIEKYPKLDEINNVKTLMAEFRSAIEASLKQDFRLAPSQDVITPATDPMRALLSKMNTYLDKQVDNNRAPKVKPRIRHQLPKDMKTKQSELNKLEEKSLIIKPIYNSSIESDENYDSLLDKFLSEDATPDSAYANKITAKARFTPPANETGFDLKEAVNPKEDLEQIMKSFDFFTATENN